MGWEERRLGRDKERQGNGGRLESPMLHLHVLAMPLHHSVYFTSLHLTPVKFMHSLF